MKLNFIKSGIFKKLAAATCALAIAGTAAIAAVPATQSGFLESASAMGTQGTGTKSVASSYRSKYSAMNLDSSTLQNYLYYTGSVNKNNDNYLKLNPGEDGYYTIKIEKYGSSKKDSKADIKANIYYRNALNNNSNNVTISAGGSSTIYVKNVSYSGINTIRIFSPSSSSTSNNVNYRVTIHYSPLTIVSSNNKSISSAQYVNMNNYNRAVLYKGTLTSSDRADYFNIGNWTEGRGVEYQLKVNSSSKPIKAVFYENGKQFAETTHYYDRTSARSSTSGTFRNVTMKLESVSSATTDYYVIIKPYIKSNGFKLH